MLGRFAWRDDSPTRFKSFAVAQVVRISMIVLACLSYHKGKWSAVHWWNIQNLFPRPAIWDGIHRHHGTFAKVQRVSRNHYDIITTDYANHFCISLLVARKMTRMNCLPQEWTSTEGVVPWSTLWGQTRREKSTSDSDWRMFLLRWYPRWWGIVLVCCITLLSCFWLLTVGGGGMGRASPWPSLGWGQGHHLVSHCLSYFPCISIKGCWRVVALYHWTHQFKADIFLKNV